MGAWSQVKLTAEELFIYFARSQPDLQLKSGVLAWCCLYSWYTCCVCLQLLGPGILPHHCNLMHSEGMVTVTPHGPDADTFVDGQRIIETTVLRSGSTIQFGSAHVFKFVDPMFDQGGKREPAMPRGRHKSGWGMGKGFVGVWMQSFHLKLTDIHSSYYPSFFNVCTHSFPKPTNSKERIGCYCKWREGEVWSWQAEAEMKGRKSGRRESGMGRAGKWEEEQRSGVTAGRLPSNLINMMLGVASSSLEFHTLTGERRRAYKIRRERRVWES